MLKYGSSLPSKSDRQSMHSARYMVYGIKMKTFQQEKLWGTFACLQKFLPLRLLILGNYPLRMTVPFVTAHLEISILLIILQCNNALFEFLFVILNQKLGFFELLFTMKIDVFPFYFNLGV